MLLYIFFKKGEIKNINFQVKHLLKQSVRCWGVINSSVLDKNIYLETLSHY